MRRGQQSQRMKKRSFSRIMVIGLLQHKNGLERSSFEFEANGDMVCPSGPPAPVSITTIKATADRSDRSAVGFVARSDRALILPSRRQIFYQIANFAA